MDKRPIGIFDSGVGGLTVVKEVIRLLPHENIVYLGDTANLPYGEKSEEIIKAYSVANTDFLLKSDIKVLVVACNTASSVALQHLKDRYDIPIIGVIEPAVKGALYATRNKKVGVIGTNRTIKSNVYPDSLEKAGEGVSSLSRACPLFVPLIEEDFIDHEATRLIATEYLKMFAEGGVDTLILGCTHYPLIMPILSGILPGVKLVDSASSTAKDLEQILETHKMRNLDNNTPDYRFYATDITEKLQQLAQRILNHGGQLKAEFKEVHLK